MIIDSLIRFIILIPLFGLGNILLLKEESHKENIKFVAIWTVFFALSMLLVVLSKIDPSYATITAFLGIAFSINYLTISLLVLSSFLLFVSLFISREEISNNIKKYYVLMLIVEEVLLLLFLSTDIITFFILSDLSLIIIFLLFGITTEDTFSSIKFFIFIIIETLISLFGIVYIIHLTGITEINVLSKYTFAPSEESVIFWTLFLPLSIQSAMIPLHVWLTNINKYAPISLSVIFSCIILLIGSFAILTILVPITKHACIKYKFLIISLEFFSIIYATILALIQRNLKQTLTYAAIINSSLIAIGIFSGTKESLSGAFFCMISGNISSSSLFALIYIIKRKYGSLNIDVLLKSQEKSCSFLLISIIPILALLYIPPFPTFIGKFFILFGLFDSNYFICAMLVFVMSGAIFYLIRPYQKIFLGNKNNGAVFLNKYDLMYIPLTIFAIVTLTIYSNNFMKSIMGAISKINIVDLEYA